MDIDYQRVFEATPSPYLILSPDFRIMTVNEAYLSATMTRRNEILGRDLFEVFPDNPADPGADGVRNLRDSLQRVLATGAPDVMALQKYDILRRRGEDASFEERYWSPINSPVLGPDGSVALLIHRVEDVTEFVRLHHEGERRHRLTEELQRRAEAMEADLYQRAHELADVNRLLRLANDELTTRGTDLRLQQEAKDRFLATLSHELRNPLTAIQGALEILDLELGDPDESEIRAMWNVISRQTTALVRMTNDLLDATRAMVGKLELERQPVDAALLVTCSIEDARPAFDAGGRTLSLSVPGTPVWIDGDRIRLAQALGNLLHNARKFTEPGGHVSVDLSVEASRAVIRVRDDGAGFDPSCGDEFFGVFAQGDQSSTRRSGGIGLGLAIVRSIVELHGGRVTAHSDGPVTGATFTITLPTLPAATPTAAAAVRRGEGSVSLRVLLVEDEPDIGATYRSLLARLGHRAEVAESGLYGVQRAVESSPDVVLCDVGLPDIDGYEVARRLRRDGRTAHIRLVAVSGYGQDVDRLQSVQAGFDEHLVKPLTSSALAEALTPQAGQMRP